MNELRFIKLDSSKEKDIDLICYLHDLFLPESNVPGLGMLFMKKFYYKVLPERDLINCFFAVCDKQIVGMMVATKYPDTLIKRGLKGNRLKLLMILLISVIQKPSRIKFLLRQLRYKTDPAMKVYEQNGKTIELLTIGVMKEYRSFRLENNKKITHKLVEHVMKYYNKLGYEYFTGQILKDNKAALKLYTEWNAKYTDSLVRDQNVILEMHYTS